ncbi:phage minor tail protein L [Escherichia coli]|nr:phage minor tail protein L [Escherichia coli]EHL6891503.1 phage minor tail protein L [Escherichia coli]EHY4341843.1 phage minor tail protein L [Escherichia coli]
MQNIHEESLNESVKSEQSPRVVLWEIDLTVQGGERYFFCNELNEKREPVTWQGRQYQAYPIEGSGFEMNGKGSSARPSLTVSNLFGLVTGMAEDLQSLVGATVVRRRVYARFLDAVNFVAGNPEADPEQELTDRWVVEQMSSLTAMTASFVLATPTETDGALFPGRIMHHAAIYCGNGELLHHLPEQLSKRERYSEKWQRRTHSAWRHRHWHVSAFTGIYNDLAAASACM